MVWLRNKKTGGLFNTDDIKTRAEYHYEKNKQNTNKAYDKYVKERDKDNPDFNKVKKYKDDYLKKYNKENDRNITIANAEEYKGDTSNLKGKHIKNNSPYEKYDPYKGTPYERKYNSTVEVMKDPNSKLNQYINKKAISKAETTGDFSKMTRRQLAEYIVDNQIERGVIKAETRDLQINGRIKGMGASKGMSKADLQKGAEDIHKYYGTKEQIERYKRRKK